MAEQSTMIKSLVDFRHTSITTRRIQSIQKVSAIIEDPTVVINHLTADPNSRWTVLFSSKQKDLSSILCQTNDETRYLTRTRFENNKSLIGDLEILWKNSCLLDSFSLENGEKKNNVESWGAVKEHEAIHPIPTSSHYYKYITEKWNYPLFVS